MSTLTVTGTNGRKRATVTRTHANAYAAWTNVANALYAKLGRGWVVERAEVA